jgi:hypothetical protein
MWVGITDFLCLHACISDGCTSDCMLTFRASAFLHNCLKIGTMQQQRQYVKVPHQQHSCSQPPRSLHFNHAAGSLHTRVQ